MHKHVAHPHCRSAYMTSRICMGSTGGSKYGNSTYELLVMVLQMCYENDTQTLKDAEILSSKV